MNTANDLPEPTAGVVLVAGDATTRRALRRVIDAAPDLRVAGEARSLDRAAGEIERARGTVAVVDLSMAGWSGLDIVRRLKTRHEDLPILVLSSHRESFYVERVLRAGARGYLARDEVDEHLPDAVRRVLAGKIFLSPRMVSSVLNLMVRGEAADGVLPVHRLSDRELQVFELLGQGLSSREVAERLGLSLKTVETHQANARRKLDLADGEALRRSAGRWQGSTRTTT